MAQFERPAGGFTPTLATSNTTKYQDDSALTTKISSSKVDGDINQAIEASNVIWALNGGTSNVDLPLTLIDYNARIITTNSRIDVNTASIVSLISGSVPDGTFGEITISGGATIYTLNTGTITTAHIVDDAVTSVKIVDDSITTEKLDTSGKLAVDMLLYRNFT